MRCESCGNEVAVYELYPRSYRLYVYLCMSCERGFLAHHFDLNLEIYQMEEVAMKQNERLIFITGLKSEPRVFDFEVEKTFDSVIVADKDVALGEIALKDEGVFAPYSEKAIKRLARLLGLPQGTDIKRISKKVIESWEQAK